MGKRRGDLRRDLEELKRRAEGVFGQGRRTFVKPGRRGGEVAGLRPAGHGDHTRADVEGDGPKLSPGAIEEIVDGEEHRSEGGRFYRIITEANEIWDGADEFHDQYLAALADPFPTDVGGLEQLKILKDLPTDDICYLDIETTGFRGSPLFLIGLMYTKDRNLVVEQLFARDYTEEAAVLGFTADVLRSFRVLVTFNGISFDVPMIMERMAYSGMTGSMPEFHVDLLHLSRKLLGRKTPNHKLQTLEAFLLNKRRIGDVPGSEIPLLYHEYVRTGDAADMAGIIHHNRQDLVTMLQLVAIYLTGGF